MTRRGLIAVTELDPPIPWIRRRDALLARRLKHVAVGPYSDPFRIVISRGVRDADRVEDWLGELGYKIQPGSSLDIGHHVIWRRAVGPHLP